MQLTQHQLVTAAHDLRNAAMVIKHAGHFQGSLVDYASGSVCAVGAIELATYKTLVTRTFSMSPSAGFMGLSLHHDDPGLFRCEAAITVLADMIPTGLCSSCDPEASCECGCKNTREMEPFDLVTHYNDQHCTGDKVAINMMRLAADKAEATADSRRQALEDFRVSELVGV